MKESAKGRFFENTGPIATNPGLLLLLFIHPPGRSHPLFISVQCFFYQVCLLPIFWNILFIPDRKTSVLIFTQYPEFFKTCIYSLQTRCLFAQLCSFLVLHSLLIIYVKVVLFWALSWAELARIVLFCAMGLKRTGC